MPERLPIGADVVEAAARAQLASEESRVDTELVLPNAWEDLSEQDRAECFVDMEAAIRAALDKLGLREDNADFPAYEPRPYGLVDGEPSELDRAATIIRGLLYNDDERPQVEIEAEATRFLSGTSRSSATSEGER